ncbi:MAG: Nif3-like dinuclear metal center hexameric protein [Muribaculaceae bacterium]|nr:Nif3-like dinuclear metal center hexameric protein [Muribaculaceae bacterium]
MTHRQIIKAIEEIAPLSLQEEWDNSGFQAVAPDDECTGALLCVDVTEDIISEARSRGCSLVISHHPLLCRGIKQVLGRKRVDRTLAEALRNDITIYSAHTSADNAPDGVSWEMARRLGLTGCTVLAPHHGSEGKAGCGVIGTLQEAITPGQLVEKIKTAFNSPVARCSDPQKASPLITKIALCGGAGSDFIPAAIAAGAQAYINSDTKLNFFLDNADDIFIIDIGHYESENCTKDIF